MTPTLNGRWQSRLFLMGTLGFIVTLFFVIAFESIAPLIILFLVMLFGFGWDIVYTLVQKWRWDHDWPPIFQLTAGIWEAIFIGFLIFATPFLGPLIGPGPQLWQFVLHYSAVWLAVFAGSQSLMRLVFPRWRYNGGQWI